MGGKKAKKHSPTSAHNADKRRYVCYTIVGHHAIHMDDKDKIYKDWIKFLNADEVKFNLICSSLYLTAYELLIDSFVKKTKEFFIVGFTKEEWTISKDYKSQVKALYPKDIVVASAMWLKNIDAITEEDIEKIKAFKTHRNALAHELPKVITDSDFDLNLSYFKEIRDLYKKIHLWWFKEVEFSLNPNLDNIDPESLDYDEVLSFIMMPMDYMINIVNDEIEKREQKKSTNAQQGT